MEDTNQRNPSQENEQEWQRENEGDMQQTESAHTDAVEIRGSQVGGFSTEDAVIYASANNEDRDDKDDDDDNDDDDKDDATDNDWGSVDPQENGIIDSNDPSGPGSAV